MNHFSVAEQEIRINKHSESANVRSGKIAKNSKYAKKENEEKTNFKNLKMSEILMLSFYCHGKKKDKRFSLFKEKREEYEKFLEVGTLFNLYKNFDFLENILLKEEQVTVFRIGLCLKFDETPDSKEDFHKDIEKIVDYFKRNLRNDELGKIDTKIIGFLKSNINQLSFDEHVIINDC